MSSVYTKRYVHCIHNIGGTWHCCINFKLSGKSIKCASGGTVRVYPYDEQDPVGPKRTHKDTLVKAQKAMTENKNAS